MALLSTMWLCAAQASDDWQGNPASYMSVRPLQLERSLHTKLLPRFLYRRAGSALQGQSPQAHLLF